MSVLLWTFAPVFALVLATGWAHWRNRPRGPVDAQDSISEYERFRAAIAEPIAFPRRPPDEIDLRDPVDVERSRVRAG